MRCFLRSAGLAGLIFLIILLASCNNAVADSNNNNTPKSAADVGDILVFYGPDGLGDSSYVDKFCIGAHKAALEHGLSVYDAKILSRIFASYYFKPPFSRHITTSFSVSEGLLCSKILLFSSKLVEAR